MAPTPTAVLLSRAGIVAHRVIRKRLAPWKLSPIQYEMLCWLGGGRPSHLRELARQLRLNRQSVLAAARGLLERGLVRKIAGRDARLVILAVEPPGEALLDEVAPAIARLDNRIGRAVGSACRPNFVEGLERIQRSFLGAKEMTWSD